MFYQLKEHYEMNSIKLINTIYLHNSKTSKDSADCNAVQSASDYNNGGADELFIIDLSENDAEHDTNIGIIKKIAEAIDIPMIVGGNVNRLEDVKKYLYAGAKMAVLDMGKPSNAAMVKEASDRFGKDKIAVMIPDGLRSDIYENVKEQGASLIIGSEMDLAAQTGLPVFINEELTDYTLMTESDSLYGYRVNELSKDKSVMEMKHDLKRLGVGVSSFESQIAFSDFTLNHDGMIPVVVQDYKTNEVLMLAYMNEEAFQHTLKTGRMTYYSRSRRELWEKGLTSGHFQYVKSLSLDCDNDTILAKVYQTGAACHTGAYSCFYKELAKKEYEDTNPLKVFEDVYQIILDRKANPKEGSYTNYLFDKGIDKILKKIGEEATEIIIAAKNPDPEEIKYEISDFLYHVMVLMAERGVSWKEITRELARR